MNKISYIKYENRNLFKNAGKDIYLYKIICKYIGNTIAENSIN